MRIRKSKTDKKIFGVIGGIAHYYNIDPTVLRIMVVLCCFCNISIIILLYFLLFLIME